MPEIAEAPEDENDPMAVTFRDAIIAEGRALEGARCMYLEKPSRAIDTAALAANALAIVLNVTDPAYHAAMINAVTCVALMANSRLSPAHPGVSLLHGEPAGHG